MRRGSADLEREQKAQGKKIADVFKAIQKLFEPPPDKPRRAIGMRFSSWTSRTRPLDRRCLL